jgi:hypothetical protein
LPAAIRAIEDRIADADGELTPEDEKALAGLEGDLERKLEWVAMLAREASAEAEAFKGEADRLTARRKAAENRADGLKHYAMRVMEDVGLTKLKGELMSLSIVRNSAPSITVNVPVEALPEQFLRVTVAPDLTALRQAIKDGEEVEGVTAEYGHHIRVR